MKPITKPEEQLDCIAMKRRIQSEVYKETKGMTPEQRLAYYKAMAARSREALRTPR